jgi:hypothetical protein
MEMDNRFRFTLGLLLVAAWAFSQNSRTIQVDIAYTGSGTVDANAPAAHFFRGLGGFGDGRDACCNFALQSAAIPQAYFGRLVLIPPLEKPYFCHGLLVLLGHKNNVVTAAGAGHILKA